MLIAYDNPDGVSYKDPPLTTYEEMPVLPPASDDLPSEAEFVLGKSLISFGIMLSGIIILVIILMTIKKNKTNTTVAKTDTIDNSLSENPAEKTSEEVKEELKSPPPMPIRSQKNLVINIHLFKCIK